MHDITIAHFTAGGSGTTLNESQVMLGMAFRKQRYYANLYTVYQKQKIDSAVLKSFSRASSMSFFFKLTQNLRRNTQSAKVFIQMYRDRPCRGWNPSRRRANCFNH
jgi:hypothetical protein